jgi:plasmid stabilization system protein ParE
MARRVVWSKNADRIFTKILEYYIQRNGSKNYSRKLSNEVLKLIRLISNRPFVGIRSDNENVRLFIKGNYKIFYQIEPDFIIIQLVWDCRQNPESLSITM